MPTWVSQEKWNLCQHFKFYIFEFDLMGGLPGVRVCCIVFLMDLTLSVRVRSHWLLSSSSLATCVCPLSAANIRAVVPWLSWMLASAPWLSSRRTITTRPCLTAKCRAVWPVYRTDTFMVLAMTNVIFLYFVMTHKVEAKIKGFARETALVLLGDKAFSTSYGFTPWRSYILTGHLTLLVISNSAQLALSRWLQRGPKPWRRSCIFRVLILY